MTAAALAALAAVTDAVLLADQGGTIYSANAAAVRLLAVEESELQGRGIDNCLRIDAGDGPTAMLAALKDTSHPGGHRSPLAWQGTLYIVGAQCGSPGPRVEVRLLPVPEAGQPAGEVSAYAVVIRNLSAGAIDESAGRDALTQLADLRGFTGRLQQLIAESGGDHHILLYIDICQLQRINDRCGQAAGDAFLVAVSQFLQREPGGAGLAARIGGDEFALLLLDHSLAEAQAFLRALRQACNRFEFPWDDQVFGLSLSIGAVPVTPGDADGQHLLDSAREACLAARAEGRNRVKLLGLPGEQSGRRRDADWMAELHGAMADGRLLLYRQPVVALQNDMALHHYEVLLRLQGRDGALVSPGEFLPAAERCGMMDELDRWVLERVFAFMSQRNDDDVYAINISGASLGDPRFADFALSQLTRYGVAPSRVQFEITESCAIDNLDLALVFIHRLRAAGCSFALDDFGKGVSSLAHLRQLPVDHLKIDGSFVRNLLHDDIDTAMVSTIHHLARCMGITTIAEYVESAALSDKLAGMGVDFAQGYAIARPSPLPAC